MSVPDLPRAVKRHIYEVTGATVTNQRVMIWNIKPEMLGEDIVFVPDLQQHFPFMGKLVGTASMVEYEDGATLVVFTDKKFGKFFLYVQHARLRNCISDGRLVLSFESKALGTTVLIQLCTPYLCAHCGKAAEARKELLLCSLCNSKHAKFFYCDKNCQTANWKIHKHICAGK